jgi:hypothetical protein
MSFADKVFAVCMSVACVAGGIVLAFDYGRDYERTKATRDLWENPPGMSSCVVYPDGGKRCTSAAVREPTPLVECIRQCRAVARMAKIK